MIICQPTDPVSHYKIQTKLAQTCTNVISLFTHTFSVLETTAGKLQRLNHRATDVEKPKYRPVLRHLEHLSVVNDGNYSMSAPDEVT